MSPVVSLVPSSNIPSEVRAKLQVTATDQIDVGKGRVPGDIVLGENHFLPDIACDREMITLAYEVFGKIFHGHVPGDAFQIDPAAGVFYSPSVHVGGEDFEIDGMFRTIDMLLTQDRQAVGFFPGRAARDPETRLAISDLAE
jgi:hypothetical protein